MIRFEDAEGDKGTFYGFTDRGYARVEWDCRPGVRVEIRPGAWHWLAPDDLLGKAFE